MSMRGVLITGASGFIGRHVVRLCAARGWSAWAWTRDVARTRARLGAQAQVVSRLEEIPADAPIDAIVNLAGAQVIGPPWTQSQASPVDRQPRENHRRGHRLERAARIAAARHHQCQRHRLLRSGAGRMARRILTAAAADVSVAAVHRARRSGECRKASRHARGESAPRPGAGRRRRHPAASRIARKARNGGGDRRRAAMDVVDPPR